MGKSQPPGFTGGRLITYETSYAPYRGSILHSYAFGPAFMMLSGILLYFLKLLTNIRASSLA